MEGSEGLAMTRFESASPVISEKATASQKEWQ
jgi:hypothetical protein